MLIRYRIHQQFQPIKQSAVVLQTEVSWSVSKVASLLSAPWLPTGSTMAHLTQRLTMSLGDSQSPSNASSVSFWSSEPISCQSLLDGSWLEIVRRRVFRLSPRYQMLQPQATMHASSKTLFSIASALPAPVWRLPSRLFLLVARLNIADVCFWVLLLNWCNKLVVAMLSSTISQFCSLTLVIPISPLALVSWQFFSPLVLPTDSRCCLEVSTWSSIQSSQQFHGSSSSA